jgi:C-8 sterol isomerase
MQDLRVDIFDSRPLDLVATGRQDAGMGTIFDPDELHQIAKQSLSKPNKTEMFEFIGDELKRRYPTHITLDNPWIFNNAGGAMGQLKLLHCSISEYILLFGSPIGTEGHSGRYTTEVYDFMLDGEMWCYHAGDFERVVYRPGDAAYLGADRAKGYALPSGGFMLEYSRGPIPTMLPFGLADTCFSTLDRHTIGRTLWQYGKLVVKELAQGKV